MSSQNRPGRRLQAAQVWGWIDHNPMALATRPAVRRLDLQPPQVAQAERLIDTAMAEDPELGLFLVLAVVLGARRGEVCRLRWSLVDLDRGEIVAGGKSSASRELRDEEWTKNRSKRRMAPARRRNPALHRSNPPPRRKMPAP